MADFLSFEVSAIEIFATIPAISGVLRGFFWYFLCDHFSTEPLELKAARGVGNHRLLGSNRTYGFLQKRWSLNPPIGVSFSMKFTLNLGSKDEHICEHV